MTFCTHFQLYCTYIYSALTTRSKEMSALATISEAGMTLVTLTDTCDMGLSNCPLLTFMTPRTESLADWGEEEEEEGEG